MSYSFLNGRLRIQEKCGCAMLSLVPSAFPQLICSVPFAENELNINSRNNINISTCDITVEKSNIQGVKRWKDRVIVDHSWSTYEATVSEKIPMLAVLSRSRIMQNECNQVLIKDSTTSIINLHWNEEINEKTDNDSIDSQFQYELAISLPFLGCNIIISSGLLIVGTSMGAYAYFVSDLMNYHATLGVPKSDVSFDQVRNVPIMKTFSIDAMDMNVTHFAAISGDRLGIWKVDDLKNMFSADYTPKFEALWTTKLCGRERITSVKISDQIIALSSWDGSAYIYRRETSSEWTRVSHDCENVSICWEEPDLKCEHEYAPTIVSILSRDDNEKNSNCDTSFALSSPNSTDIRIFDISQKQLVRRIKTQSGKEIHGMVSFQNTLFALNDLDEMIVFKMLSN